MPSHTSSGYDSHCMSSHSSSGYESQHMSSHSSSGYDSHCMSSHSSSGYDSHCMSSHSSSGYESHCMSSHSSSGYESHHMTSHSSDTSNLQRRRSKSVDLTPISESPMKLAEDPTLRLPIYLPSHNPPTTSGDSTDAVDGVCSDPEPEPGFQRQSLLREISISADNIPAVCVNDCPLTPTPLRFKDRRKMRLPLKYKFSKRILSRAHQAHIHHHLVTKSHVTPGYRSHASNLQRSKCIDLTLIGKPPVKLAEDPTLSSPIYLPYHTHASNLQFRRSKSVDLPCHTHASNLQFRRSKSVDLTLISESPVKLAEDPTLRSPIYVPYHNLPTTSGDSTDDTDRMCSDPEPDQGFQQQFLQFIRYKFSKRIPSHAHQAHIHHHLTTKSHVIHTPGYRSHASNLQRRHSKSVDLTPISEKLAEDPTLRLPIYLPSHNPPTTSGDGTDAADGVCSDPEPEPGFQRQFLLREISISADNIPAVCVNDCPLTPTPLRFKDRSLAATALSPVRHQRSSWICRPMLSRQQAHQTQKQLRPTFEGIPKQRRMLGLVKSWKQADWTQKQLSGGSSDTLATSIPPPGQTRTWTASDSSFTMTETLC